MIILPRLTGNCSGQDIHDRYAAPHRAEDGGAHQGAGTTQNREGQTS